MQILATPLFEMQLKAILEDFASQDFDAAKKFKLYLDTIIINIPTKAKKYKKSIYFDNENIKDIPHEEYTVVFFMDEEQDTYLVLNILKKIDIS